MAEAGWLRKKALRALAAGLVPGSVLAIDTEPASASSCTGDRYGPVYINKGHGQDIDWVWGTSAQIERYIVFNEGPVYAPYPDDYGRLWLTVEDHTGRQFTYLYTKFQNYAGPWSWEKSTGNPIIQAIVENSDPGQTHTFQINWGKCTGRASK